MDFDTMMRRGATDQTYSDDWWADMSAAIREFADAILAADGALNRTCGNVKRAISIIHDADVRFRRAERSGWTRTRPCPPPPVAPYRPIALRRAPPRNRARSRPGGKWAARRVA